MTLAARVRKLAILAAGALTASLGLAIVAVTMRLPPIVEAALTSASVGSSMLALASLARFWWTPEAERSHALASSGPLTTSLLVVAPWIAGVELVALTVVAFLSRSR